LLLKARSNDGDLVAALTDVGNTRGSTIVLLGVAVIVLTTVTQAFEFGAIRLLEGYWGGGPLGSALASLLVRIKAWWQRHLLTRRKAAMERAFETSRQGLVRKMVSREVIEYLAADIRDEYPLPALTAAQETELEETDWRPNASPGPLRRLEALDRRLDRMPKRHRLLPTRLGNTLRSFEDAAHVLAPGPLSGMVQRVFHRLPSHVQIELDQYRNRLGLYASLVAVSGVLAVGAMALLMSASLRTALGLAGLAIFGCLAFYGSAVSSADAYGSLLVEAMTLAAKAESTPPGP
jgi:hypothetical protein